MDDETKKRQEHRTRVVDEIVQTESTFVTDLNVRIMDSGVLTGKS